ncbi:GEVED domain-containing protein [Hymenobacter sp. ASUV-10]|uniref:GEVED domain-containing protein n=1 Tax=Hymenobacter aranciens TaxID=3063996 RepID=A0ABT9BAA2_9BACT|nr:GEVED domain-containing protein [Hymenobacter sp. ASUV-10]MDO7875194.1 GEVED domain-containing protein [Hymenobacter sp. ASUV-10]
MKTFTSLVGRTAWRSLLTLATGLGLTAAAHAQAPANDNPCGATVLTAQGALCTAPVVSTNAGATTTAPNGYANPSATQGSCGGGAAPKDVWFTFMTAATGPASFGAALTVTGNPAGTVRVYAAASCNGPFTEVQCSASGQANTVAPRLTTGALQPSTTYYVQVAGAADSDPTGAFTICLTDGPGLPTCGVPVLGTPTYASPTTATIPLTPGANNTFPVTLLVTGPAGFSQTTTAAAGPLQLTGLTQGTTYTVQVTAPCAASGQTAAPVSTTIRTPTRYCSTGLGGSCNGAVITDVEIVNSSLHNLSQNPACQSGAYANFPVAGITTATLQPGAPYQLSVKTTSTGTGDPVAAWLDFNQNGVFEANENIVPAGLANQFNALVATFQVPLGTPAGPTGLRVRSAQAGLTVLGPGAACAEVLTAGETEDYTVTIGTQASCPTPANLAVTNLTPTTATVNFTPVPGAVNYTLTYSSFVAQPAPVTLLVTGSPVQLTGLIGNSLTTISLVTNCGPGQVSVPATTTVQQPIGIPTNDECANAQLLATGPNPVPVTGSTNFGTVTSPNPTPPTVCATPVTQDVWYRFVATQSAHNVVVAIDPAGSVLVEAFAGTCASFLRLGCTRQVGSGSGGGIANTLTLPLTNLTPGQTYYLRLGQTIATVYAYGFNISVQNAGPAYCTTGLGGSPTCAGPSLRRTAIVGTTLNNLNPTCQPVNGGNYNTLAADGATTATLAAGQAYQLQATLSNGPADVSLWIDYNQNFVFEASEHTQVALAATGGVQASFTVPAGALAGNTRLRLRTRAAGAGNGPTDACTNFGSTGETADYTVTIVTTTTPPAPCAAPGSITVGSLTATTATVSFAAPAGSTGYVVQYQTAQLPLQTLTPAPTSSPFVLTGLAPGQPYTVCISSTCATGGPSAPVCSASFTPPASAACVAPTNVFATALSPSTATVVFVPGSGSSAVSYTATAVPAGGGTVVMGTAAASPLALTGLAPGTTYTVTVVANCAGNTASTAVLSTNVLSTPLSSQAAALAAQLSFSPNPAQRSVVLQVPASAGRPAGQVLLRNSLGQLVQQHPLPAASTQLELDLSQLPAGVYLVQLQAGPLTAGKRLVVE